MVQGNGTRLVVTRRTSLRRGCSARDSHAEEGFLGGVRLLPPEQEKGGEVSNLVAQHGILLFHVQAKELDSSNIISYYL